MARQRIHNEWFRPVLLGYRKSCPTCRAKHNPLTDKLWSWGEYHNAKWHTIMRFCKECFNETVVPALKDHSGKCGCTFALQVKDTTRPEWLTLGDHNVSSSEGA